MLRVRDIIAEVKKQLNALERQARQARSFQALKQEARGLEIEILCRDFRALRAELETVDRKRVRSNHRKRNMSLNRPARMRNRRPRVSESRHG